MELIKKYFPGITSGQEQQFRILCEELADWNQKINVISRKDTDNLEERHILHSLAIARFMPFRPGTAVIDVGTGGGFPGLPLAIMFPECRFTLVDSIARKIRVVEELVAATGLQNVVCRQARAETITDRFDFVVSRAVTAFPKFYRWTKNLVTETSQHDLPNGIIYLKGGDLGQELAGFGDRIRIVPVKNFFDESWFEEKKIVYLKI